MLIKRWNICRRLIPAGFLAVFLMLLPVKRIEAASFTHVHDDSCYADVVEICSNHHYENEYDFTQGYYCPLCQKYTTLETCDAYDVCDNGYREKRLIFTWARCFECFDYVKGGYYEPQSHEVTVVKQVCGLEDGATVAEVSADVLSTNWTNTEAEIVVNVSSKADSFKLAAEPYDYGQGFTSASSCKVSENGTYTVSVKDSKGNVVSVPVTVSNIDKSLPVITVSKSTEEWTEAGVILTVTASDELSGLHEKAYSFDDGDFGDSNTVEVKKNGEVRISVRDNAGNVATETIKISNIGRDPKVVAAEREAEERARAEAEAKARAEAEARERAEAAAREEEARKQAVAEAEAKKADAALKKAEAEAKKAEAAAREREAEAKIKEAEALLATKENTQEEPETEDLPENNESEGTLIQVVEMVPSKPEAEQEPEMSASEIMTTKEEIIGESEEVPSTDTISNEPEVLEYSAEKLFEEDVEKASVGGTVVKVGIILAIAGLIFSSFFNYVYFQKDGKTKPVSLVKLKKENGRIIVHIPEGKLTRHGKYMIYYSPWARILKRNRNVYVMVGNSQIALNTDAGVAFNY